MESIADAGIPDDFAHGVCVASCHVNVRMGMLLNVMREKERREEEKH